MGKRGGRRGGRGGGQPRFQRSVRSDARGDVTKSNVRFEKYYDTLRPFEDDEREDFWRTLRRELPNSFRFTGSRGQALPVQKLLKERYIPDIITILYENEHVAPPTAIEWYPDQLAWQMTTPKNVIRKFPPFAAFQKFLVSETSVGNINRQEIVSMIPPLLMDLKPGMTVLDMCAAPGSKSAQLIELVHAGEEVGMRNAARDFKGSELPHSTAVEGTGKEESQDDQTVHMVSDDGRATGLLIANDNDYRRAHMLTHQMKRLNSPNLIVSSHDATMYPSIKLSNGAGSSKYLKFDRILADVPCSGDGTCRKNINIWKDWTPANGLGLFPTQQRILVRALQMLKPGGRVVYSTCSMNPVENEAVVASTIERCGGSGNVELIETVNDLPKLKRRPGLRTWQVMDKIGNIYSTWSEAEARLESDGEEKVGKLVAAMFPNPEADIPLERCIRISPHLQDTGAFFIAVLEKKSEIKVRPEAEAWSKDPAPASIVKVVNEIKKLPDVEVDEPMGKIDALDELTAPRAAVDAIDPSAAARQNEELAPSLPTTAAKRSVDAEADALMSTKRPKIRDEVDEAAPQGAEDRQVHWPPPPGATLDASRPDEQNGHQNGLSDEPAKTEPRETPQSSNSKIGKRSNQPFEEPFKYLDADHPELDTITKFYDLSPRFPRDRFMVRNAQGNPSKTIYYTSALARDILTFNANSGFKFVHCGVKMFVKQDVQSPEVCRWRIQSEGLPLVEAWVGSERTVKLYRKSTLRALLVEMFPKIEGDGWARLGEIAERVRAIPMGCCILRVEPTDDADGFSERMTLPLWRSLHSLNLMLPKEDRSAMLLRLFNETTPLQDHSKDRFKEKQKAGETKNATEGRDGDDGMLDGDTAEAHNDQKPAHEDDAVMGNGDSATANAQEEYSSEDEEDGGVPI